MKRVLNYIKDTRGELKYVTWPTRQESMKFTAIVIVISVLAAVFLSFFDYLSSLLLEKFIL